MRALLGSTLEPLFDELLAMRSKLQALPIQPQKRTLSLGACSTASSFEAQDRSVVVVFAQVIAGVTSRVHHQEGEGLARVPAGVVDDFLDDRFEVLGDFVDSRWIPAVELSLLTVIFNV